jgi:hypothetical protein
LEKSTVALVLFLVVIDLPPVFDCDYEDDDEDDWRPRLFS